MKSLTIIFTPLCILFVLPYKKCNGFFFNYLLKENIITRINEMGRQSDGDGQSPDLIDVIQGMRGQAKKITD